MKQSDFGREKLREKQQDQMEEIQKRWDELRKTIKFVADTESGETFLRYLFLLCGGDSASVRRDKNQDISVNDTLLVLGAKSVWEHIRVNMDSDTIKKIERHNWETL